MRLEKWALVAEIVSGAAIVFTILVLILEVRTNTAVLERQLALDRVGSIFDAYDSPYVPAIIEKIKAVDVNYVGPSTRAFMDRYDLTFVEADRFTRWLTQQWSGYEAEFELGDVDKLAEAIEEVLIFPDQQLYWEVSSITYSDEFVSFVNALEPRTSLLGPD